jgi:hypothetical protein
MEIILILVLVGGLSSLFFIKKQELVHRTRPDQKKHYNPNEDYLDKVKEATKKRFEEEQAQQAYKNKIKKDYLE